MAWSMISSYEDLKRLNDRHRQPCSIFQLPRRDFVRFTNAISSEEVSTSIEIHKESYLV